MARGEILSSPLAWIMAGMSTIRSRSRKSAFLVGLGSLFFLAPWLGASAAPNKPGLWTLTTSNVVTGSPAEAVRLLNALQGKTFKAPWCVTPEQVAKNNANDPPMPFKTDRACKLTNVRSTEGTWRGELVCTPESKKGTTTIESVQNTGHFKQTMVKSGDGVQVTTIIEGQWLSSDCTALPGLREEALAEFSKSAPLASLDARTATASADSERPGTEGATCVPNRASADFRTTRREDLFAVDPVHIVMNAVSYAVPRNYFQGHPPQGCGTEETSFSIDALFPDFSGATAETAQDFKRGSKRLLHIALRSTQQTDDVEGLIRLWTNDNANSQLRFPVTWNDAEVHGLQHGTYRTLWARGADTDVYLGRDDNQVITAISCGPVTCTEVAFHKDVQVQIGFERSRLEDWRTMYSGVVALLDRFARDGISLKASRSAYSAETVNCVPYKPADRLHRSPQPTTSTERDRIVISGVRLAIPRNYFQSPKRCGEQLKSVRLRALLPDFSGATLETLAAFDQRYPGAQTVAIALSPDSRARDLDGLIERWLMRTKEGEPRYPIEWDGTQVHGLQHGIHRSFPASDVYVERRNDSVINLIKCTRLENHPTAHCTSYGSYGSTQLRIDFDGERLSEWRAIRSGAVALLDRFLREGARSADAAR
jgi:uncharacterized protein DUF3617